MAKDELVEGIKRATQKGESLKDAMMSFLNAGYKKEDIEDAARIVQSGDYSNDSNVEIIKESVSKVTSTENVPSAPATVQKISDYSGKDASLMNPKKKLFLIILFSFLLLVGISIASLLIFKDKFISLMAGA
jgi:hypothetical protein